MRAGGRWSDGSVRRALGLPGGGGAEERFEGVCTDSRTALPGDVFVAIRGERFDGHAFLAEAVERGCRAVVAEDAPDECAAQARVYRVPCTLKALGDLALHHRRRLAAPVVGITGSSGKTTVKDMTMAALGSLPRVHGTVGNRNNRVGTPMTILSAPENASALVLEMGTNEPGEIAELARIGRPSAGVVTTVAEAHTERLGDLAGVLAEKLDLLRAVEGRGSTLVGDEPPRLAEEAREIDPAVGVCGWSDRAGAARPSGARLRANGSYAFDWEGRRVALQAPGRHGVYNALLALATARLLGVSAAAAAAGVSGAVLGAMRGEVRTVGSLRVLVDCYNANPQSVVAAVAALEGMEAPGRRVAILGTMRELGERSEAIHSRTLHRVLASKIDRFLLLGAFARARAGMDDERVCSASDADFERLMLLLRPDDTVLLKASRACRFERALPEMESAFDKARN